MREKGQCVNVCMQGVATQGMGVSISRAAAEATAVHSLSMRARVQPRSCRITSASATPTKGLCRCLHRIHSSDVHPGHPVLQATPASISNTRLCLAGPAALRYSCEKTSQIPRSRPLGRCWSAGPVVRRHSKASAQPRAFSRGRKASDRSPASTMAAQLGQLLSCAAQLGDQRSKAEAYKAALAQILEAASPEACQEFVSHSEPETAEGRWRMQIGRNGQTPLLCFLCLCRVHDGVISTLPLLTLLSGCLACLAPCSAVRRSAAGHQPAAAAALRTGPVQAAGRHAHPRRQLVSELGGAQTASCARLAGRPGQPAWHLLSSSLLTFHDVPTRPLPDWHPSRPAPPLLAAARYPPGDLHPTPQHLPHHHLPGSQAWTPPHPTRFLPFGPHKHEAAAAALPPPHTPHAPLLLPGPHPPTPPTTHPPARPWQRPGADTAPRGVV